MQLKARRSRVHTAHTNPLAARGQTLVFWAAMVLTTAVACLSWAQQTWSVSVYADGSTAIRTRFYGDSASLAWSSSGRYLGIIHERLDPLLTERLTVEVLDTTTGHFSLLYSSDYRSDFDFPSDVDVSDLDGLDEHDSSWACSDVVDDRRVSVRHGLGLFVTTASGREFWAHDGRPATYVNSIVPTDPCLSPNGRFAAYFNGAVNQVQVEALPTDEVIEASVSPTVLIPGGTVVLGLADAEIESHLEACRATGSSRCSESRLARERPAVEAHVDSFAMDRTEVSRAQYDRCVNADRCDEVDESQCDIYDGDDWATGRVLPLTSQHPSAPRTCVTRAEAEQYCRFENGRRLPSEAEWQMAAGGPGRHRVFAWGDDFDADRAVFGATQPPVLQPVWSHRRGATPEGLLHMSGNAYEWVSSPGCPLDDWIDGEPQCEGQAAIRGGSMVSDGGGIRTTYRRFTDPASRNDTIGFRCADSVDTDQLCEILTRRQRSRTSYAPPEFTVCHRGADGIWGLDMTGWVTREYTGSHDADDAEYQVVHIRTAASLLESEPFDWLIDDNLDNYFRVENRVVDAQLGVDGGQEVFLVTVEQRDDDGQWFELLTFRRSGDSLTSSRRRVDENWFQTTPVPVAPPPTADGEHAD